VNWVADELRSLLDETEAAIRRFIIVGQPELTALALFVAHTWAIGAAEFTPYVWVSSAEKRSGKTNLLTVVAVLVRDPLPTVNISEAALFRTLDARPVTLILDEIDTIFTEKPSDTTEGLRGILNAGHRRGAQVQRCVGIGSATEVRGFNVFGAKLLAGIGSHVPETTSDRCIRIRMHRKTPADQVEKCRARAVDQVCLPLRDRWQSIADELEELLRDAVPVMPPELDDRAADIWEALVAIADAAGGAWPETARAATIGLATGDGREDTSVGVQLLAGIRAVLGAAPGVWTIDLLRGLAADLESPFATWVKDGSPESWAPRKLANLLKEFGVKSKTVWIGSESAKGYHAADLRPVFARYLPAEPPGESGSVDGQARGDQIGRASCRERV